VIGSEPGLGMSLDLGRGGILTGRDDFAIFSESVGRFLVEVRAGHEGAFEGLPVSRVGEVLKEGALRIRGLKGKEHILERADLTSAWRGE
ncbi:MAG: hypothetical protein QHG94_07210, partial [Candidatus Methanosuratincola sp.]|nr:hypothetical protein [Candidatus Methanosuratincola sp.]